MFESSKTLDSLRLEARLTSNLISDLTRFKFLNDSTSNPQNSLSSDFLYFLEDNGKTLCKYNICTKVVKRFCIKNLIPGSYIMRIQHISGSVLLIFAVTYPIRYRLYLLLLPTLKFIEIPNFSQHPSSYIYISASNFIYAFIGPYRRGNSRYFYRFELHRMRWERLLDRKLETGCVCPHLIKNKFILIGRLNTIKALDTDTLKLIHLDIEKIRNHDLIAGKYLPFIDCERSLRLYDINSKAWFDFNTRESHQRYDISYATYDNSLYFHTDYDGIVKFNINYVQHEIKSYEMFHYKHNSYSRYIYSNIFNKYDLKRKLSYHVTFKTIRDILYDYSSTCIIYNSLVFVSALESCFIFNPSDYSYTKIPKIPTCRSFVSLVYYNETVYAFGGDVFSGKISKCAEMYDLMKGSWYKLRDMIHERKYASTVAMYNKIYITCGNVSSMEIYDVERDVYTLAGFTFPYSYAVSVILDDSVYVINSDHYKIVSREGEIIEEGHHRYCKGETKTLVNVIVRGDCIYFKNKATSRIEFRDISNKIGGLEWFEEIYEYIG
jgi:hypothetical protein